VRYIIPILRFYVSEQPLFMLSPPSVDIDGLPRLLPFKYPKTEDQVFTHRSYFARPTAVFEDPPGDPAPDNEVLEYIGDSVLSLAVVTLAKSMYRTSARSSFFQVAVILTTASPQLPYVLAHTRYVTPVSYLGQAYKVLKHT